jgi:hypothetical protein
MENHINRNTNNEILYLGELPKISFLEKYPLVKVVIIECFDIKPWNIRSAFKFSIYAKKLADRVTFIDPKYLLDPGNYFLELIELVKKGCIFDIIVARNYFIDQYGLLLSLLKIGGLIVSEPLINRPDESLTGRNFEHGSFPEAVKFHLDRPLSFMSTTVSDNIIKKKIPTKKLIYIHSIPYIFDNDVELIENFHPLKMYSNISHLDRDVALIINLIDMNFIDSVIHSTLEYGGYRYLLLKYLKPELKQSISCAVTENVTINECLYKKNDNKYGKRSFLICDDDPLDMSSSVYFIYSKNVINDQNIECRFMRGETGYEMYKYLYVYNSIYLKFSHQFSDYISFNKDDDVTVPWDNLLHLTMIVKNAGDGFENVLRENLKFIDRWTILDTGSTDNTVEIINKVMPLNKGKLYQEPFINFRDSRNRCLELAGNSCVFLIMLDDTYIIKESNPGSFRNFLTMARSDDEFDSFSIYITDDATTYGSNRIFKTSRYIRYRYLIHEIPVENYNAVIPKEYVFIYDVPTKYMQERTKNRKENDIKLLYQELHQNPDDSRILYYLGETYYCIADWENAFKYYKLRTESTKPGYCEEIHNSWFKMGIIGERLGLDWSMCEYYYLKCYECNPTKSEGLYQVAEHNNDESLFRKCFELGEPSDEFGMNRYVNIYNYLVPLKMLTYLYLDKNYILGQDTAIKIYNFLMSREYDPNLSYNTVTSWYEIFKQINIFMKYSNSQHLEVSFYDEKKLMIFVTDGGWKPWDGNTLRTDGLGGSETCLIRYAEQIVKTGNWYVIIFGNPPENSIINDVEYRHVDSYPEYIATHHVDECIISRYFKYYPMSIVADIKNIHLMFHDLNIPGEVLIDSINLKNIFCLTNSHKEHIQEAYPLFSDKLRVISYGIDVADYSNNDNLFYHARGNPLRFPRFIYPSFPNRGLIHLLEIFPKIIERYPKACLDIFCDFENEYCKKNCDIEKIKELISTMKDNVTNHGFVSRSILNDYWKNAHIWLYSNTFKETFCLTALEAAASRTLAITNNMGALQETVGDRGIIVEGDPTLSDWQNSIIDKVYNVLDGIINIDTFIDRNYTWACSKTYQNVVDDFLNMLNI